MHTFRRKLPDSWEIIHPEDVGLTRDLLEQILDKVKQRYYPDDIVYMCEPFIAIDVGPTVYVCKKIVRMGGVCVFLTKEVPC